MIGLLVKNCSWWPISNGVAPGICQVVKEFNNKTTYWGGVKVSNRPEVTRRYLANSRKPLACLWKAIVDDIIKLSFAVKAVFFSLQEKNGSHSNEADLYAFLRLFILHHLCLRVGNFLVRWFLSKGHFHKHPGSSNLSQDVRMFGE